MPDKPRFSDEAYQLAALAAALIKPVEIMSKQFPNGAVAWALQLVRTAEVALHAEEEERRGSAGE